LHIGEKQRGSLSAGMFVTKQFATVLDNCLAGSDRIRELASLFE